MPLHINRSMHYKFGKTFEACCFVHYDMQMHTISNTINLQCFQRWSSSCYWSQSRSPLTL